MRRRYLANVALSSFALLIAGCDHDVNATATCMPPSHFEGDIGVLNVPGFRLGSIVAIDEASLTAWHAASAKVPTDATVIGETTELLRQAYKSDLDVVVSGSLTDQLKAEIASAVKKSSVIEVRDTRRTDLRTPLTMIESDPVLINELAKHQAEKTVFFLVSAVNSGRGVHVAASNAKSGTAGAQIIQHGDYKVNINYQCDSALEVVSEKGYPFFKYTAFRLVKNGDRYSVQGYVLKEDISRIRMVAAFM